jgi:hypothetical protein
MEIIVLGLLIGLKVFLKKKIFFFKEKLGVVRLLVFNSYESVKALTAAVCTCKLLKDHFTSIHIYTSAFLEARLRHYP